MDWDLAIKRNSEALKGIIEVLFALLGLDGTDAAQRIPKSLHSAVLQVLRPAESAVRRLIVIAARGLVVKLAPARPMPEGRKIGKGRGSRLPSFQLCDTRKDFPELRQHRVKYAKYPPRILFFGPGSKVDDLWPSPPPAAEPPPPDGLVKAERVTRRLQALKSALDDLPRQARYSNRRSGRVRLRATASGTFIPSMTSSPTATGWPGTRCGPTQAEAKIIRLRINIPNAVIPAQAGIPLTLERFRRSPE